MNIKNEHATDRNHDEVLSWEDCPEPPVLVPAFLDHLETPGQDKNPVSNALVFRVPAIAHYRNLFAQLRRAVLAEPDL